jgi:plasmid stabilization system protein ParE
MSGYAFHPEAVADLDEIWEYIAQDNIDAADGVIDDIRSSLTTLAASHTSDTGAIHVAGAALSMPVSLRPRVRIEQF